jgi:ferredoxin
MEFAGLEPERLRLDWVSASEGERYSQIVTEFVEAVRNLGPVKWRGAEAPAATKRYWVDRRNSSTKINKLTDAGIASAIQKIAAELLSRGEVSCVIGYEVGSRGRTRPAFVYDAKDVEQLVWNRSCTHNLTTYLKSKLVGNQKPEPIKKPRVAIVVKPCDSKSINVLLSENRFEREQIHIIGVACDGIQDGAGFGKSNGQYQKRCLTCNDRIPALYDDIVGEAPIVADNQPVDLALERLESMSPAQRMEFWLSQFDRCIRCYACRQACPICECPTCLYESDDSLWVGMNIEINEKRTFHLGRAYHLAGRCVGCDECERVCPMEIPISLLNRKLAKEIENAFSFKAGLSLAQSPLTTSLVEEAMK